MGKKATKKATTKVSWRTLSRQAAAIEKEKGHATLKSKQLRQMAADQRRIEREKLRITKARRPAKKATPASPTRNRLVKAAQGASNELRKKIVEAAADAAGLLGKAHDPSDSTAAMWSHSDHHKAIFEAVEGTVHRSNDNIVCSFIAMYRTGPNSGHMPWKVEGETMRALMEVLDRAGYSASGRRHNEPATESEVRKAS